MKEQREEHQLHLLHYEGSIWPLQGPLSGHKEWTEVDSKRDQSGRMRISSTSMFVHISLVYHEVFLTFWRR